MYAVLVQTPLYFIQESYTFQFLQSKLCKWEWMEEIRPHIQYVTPQGFSVSAPISKYLFRMCALIIPICYVMLLIVNLKVCIRNHRWILKQILLENKTANLLSRSLRDINHIIKTVGNRRITLAIVMLPND